MVSVPPVGLLAHVASQHHSLPFPSIHAYDFPMVNFSFPRQSHHYAVGEGPESFSKWPQEQLRLRKSWPPKTPETPKNSKSLESDWKVTFGVPPKVTPKVTFWPEKWLKSDFFGSKSYFWGYFGGYFAGNPKSHFFSHFRVTLNLSGFRGFGRSGFS